MLHIRDVRFAETPRARVTELTLSDRLIGLAEEADRAGFVGAAASLVRLACAVFDEAGRTRQSRRTSCRAPVSGFTRSACEPEPEQAPAPAG